MTRIFDAERVLPPHVRIELPSGELALPTMRPTERQTARSQIVEALSRLSKSARDAALQTLFKWSGVGVQPPHAPRPMTPEEVHRLSRMPGASIGGHSQSHLWLPLLPLSERRREIRVNKERLERLVEAPLTSFAYPYGAVTGDRGCVA